MNKMWVSLQLKLSVVILLLLSSTSFAVSNNIELFNDDDSFIVFKENLKERNIVQIKKTLNNYVDTAGIGDNRTLTIFGSILDYVRKNKNDSAVLFVLSNTLDEIIVSKPKNIVAQRLRAAVNIASPNPEKGFTLYRKLVEEYPQNYLVWTPLVNCLMAIGRTDEAFSYLEKMDDYFPDSLYVVTSKMQIEQYRKSFSTALQYGKEGLRLVQQQHLKEQETYYFLSIASIYFELNNFPASDSVYEEILDQQPNNPIILNNYAYSLSEQSVNLEYAAKLSKKSIEIVQNDESSIDTYGWILYKLKRYEEAAAITMAALRIVKEKKTSPYIILEHFADINFRLGKTDQAIAWWKSIDEDGEGSKFLKQKIKDKKIYE